MYNGQTTSLGSIIWKVMKRPMASDLTYEEAAEYALEFTKLMGAPIIYLDKVTKPLPINSYKLLTPTDMLWVKGVKYISGEGCEPIAMRHATDIYHHEASCEGDSSKFNEFTYTIQKGILTASQEDGEVVISYKGLALDDDGFPLVPDNESFKLGLEYYILHRYIEPLWEMGKITDKVFSYIEQKRHWYYSSAHTALNMPDMDQMESIMNGLNRLIINNTTHAQGFKNHGVKEQIRKYH